MAQNQRLHAAVEIVFEKIARHRVREVPVAPHHPLLHAPGIRANLQHVEIVIRFHQQNLHAAQMNFDGIGDVAQVRRDADLDAFGMKAKPDRIDGIVRNRETLHRDIPHNPARTGLKRFDPGRGQLVFPVDQRRGEARGEYRNRLCLLHTPADEPRQPRHVIRVLMRNQNRVDVLRFFADFGEPSRHFAHAEARVDQDARFRRGQKRRVSRTAAGQHAESDDDNSPSLCFSRPGAE